MARVIKKNTLLNFILIYYDELELKSKPLIVQPETIDLAKNRIAEFNDVSMKNPIRIAQWSTTVLVLVLVVLYV